MPDPKRDHVARWRCYDLRDEIEVRWLVRLHVRSVGKLLHRLKITWLQPRLYHPQVKPTVSRYQASEEPIALGDAEQGEEGDKYHHAYPDDYPVRENFEVPDDEGRASGLFCQGFLLCQTFLPHRRRSGPAEGMDYAATPEDACARCGLSSTGRAWFLC